MSKIKKITIENLVFGPDEEWFLEAEGFAKKLNPRKDYPLFLVFTISFRFSVIFLTVFVLDSFGYDELIFNVTFDSLRFSQEFTIPALLTAEIGLCFFMLIWGLSFQNIGNKTPISEMKFRLRTLENSKFKMLLSDFIIERKKSINNPSELKNLNRLAIRFATRIYRLEKLQTKLLKEHGIKNVEPVEKMCIDFYSF